MTQQSLQTLGSSLQAMPVAMVFSTQQSLTQKAPVKRTTGSPDEQAESHSVRATKMTAILKGIPGYNHDGLNE